MKKQDTIIYDHVHLKPIDQIAAHSQSEWELSFVIKGSGFRVLGDKTEPFRSGEIILVVPGMNHQWAFDPTDTDEDGCIENITVVFPAHLLEDLARVIPEYLPVSEWFRSLRQSVKISGSACETFQDLLRRMEYESPVGRTNILLSILTEIPNSKKLVYTGHVDCCITPEEKVKRVKTFINCNFQREILIDQLASYINMNRSALCSLFRKQTGTTIIGYLLHVRLRNACHLLTSQKHTIAECCYMSGFNDVPYFNRVFKRVFGVAPNQYRRNSRE